MPWRLPAASPRSTRLEALVSVSRAQKEARVYADSVEAFEVRVMQETGHRQDSVDFMDRAREQEECQRQEREQPAVDLQAPAMSTFERELRELAAQKYPKETRERAAWLEERIRQRVQEHEARQKVSRAYQSHPSQQQQREQSIEQER